VEEVFSYGWKGIRHFLRKNHVAILYTLIFHLVVLIIMIFVKVQGLKQDQELGVEIEFEEKSLDEILEEETAEIPQEWLDEIMRQRELSSNRAVNVNAEDQFSEEISTDEYVQDLLDQIEQARKEEDRERLEELQAILAAADYVPPQNTSNEDEDSNYSGPTTITYEFQEPPLQRGKVKLTIPVYRCQGSGLVRVQVTVARNGKVTSAEVNDPIEGNDRVCFEEAAMEAARSSQFRIDLNAPEKHRAVITYTFIAQ
jgi:TonB family protein